MPYRRLLTPILVSLALLGAACAAEEADPASSPEPAPTTAQEQEAAEPSEPAAPTTTEGQPTVTAVEAETTPDVAPAVEAEASAATEEAPEVEPATAPEPEPEATPQPDAAPEAQVTPEPEPEAEPEDTSAPEPEATPEAQVTPEPEVAPEPEPEATPDPETEAAPEPEATPEPEADQQPSPVVSEVLALLDALTVAAEHDDGYDRDLFRHWIDADRDGCDTQLAPRAMDVWPKLAEDIERFEVLDCLDLDGGVDLAGAAHLAINDLWIECRSLYHSSDKVGWDCGSQPRWP